MSFAATLWAWQQEDISATQKLVLLDLCDRANAANQCWPKQLTISGRVRLTERAVCTALAALQQKGLIRRLPRIKFGKRTSDLITVLAANDKPEASPVACNTQPKPPQPSHVSTGLPAENGSGSHQKFVQPDSRHSSARLACPLCADMRHKNFSNSQSHILEQPFASARRSVLCACGLPQCTAVPRAVSQKSR
jgi:hypothetical protein